MEKEKKNLSQKKLCHAKIEIVAKIFLQRFVRVSVSCDILSRVAARPNFFFLSFLWLTGLSCLSRCFPVVVINTFPSLVKTNSIFRENEDFYRL